MPKISVIVPIYNVEKYLERCLNSIINQTFNDIEVICINDGSTDNSGKILNKYQKYTNFRIIEQTNVGISETRNIGLNLAQGDYISFIDSDDFIDSNFYEVLYNNAVKFKADIACAGIIRENEKKSAKIIEYKNIQITDNIKDKFILSQCPKYNFVWNKIYKRDFLTGKNISFVSGMIYEDMCFTPDILEKSGALVVCTNTYYHYWKHKNSLIKKNCAKSRADKIAGTIYLKNKCKQYKITVNINNEILYLEDYIFCGIPILRKKNYRATQKYYLFTLIPFLEIRKKI